MSACPGGWEAGLGRSCSERVALGALFPRGWGSQGRRSEPAAEGAGEGAEDPQSRRLSLGRLAAASPGPGPAGARSVRARAAPSVAGASGGRGAGG